MKKMKMEIVGVFFLVIMGANPCSVVRVCLTWKVKNNNLKLTCKVSNLGHQVVIIDPKGIERAYCVPPISQKHVKCYPSNVHDVVKQNLKSKETTLTIKDKISENLNGNWTCKHAETKGSAKVEVTVTNPNNGKSSDCGCIFMLLSSTMTSFLIASVLLRVIIWIYDCISKKDSTAKRISHFIQSIFKAITKCSRCIDHENQRTFSVCRKIIFIVMFAYVVIVPIVVGITEHGTCRGREAFFAVGAVFGAMSTLLIFGGDNDITMENNSQPDEDAPINMEEEDAV